jgi:hypothetical protein
MERGCNRIFSSPISYRKYTTFPYLYDNIFDGLRIRLHPFLTYFRWAAPAATPYLRWAAPSASPISIILRRFAAATRGKSVCFFSHEVALYSKHRVQPCAMRYVAIRYNTMQYNAMQCNMIRCKTICFEGKNIRENWIYHQNGGYDELTLFRYLFNLLNSFFLLILSYTFLLIFRPATSSKPIYFSTLPPHLNQLPKR